MLRLIGRVVIVLLIGTALAWGVWTYALSRTDTQIKLFEEAANVRLNAARPARAATSDFRATVCAAGPCILVEAGGLAFLVDAGEGAARELASRGLLRTDIDGVLLTDLSVASIGGLGVLRDATWRAGRKEPLPVFGPAGVERVVQGVNLAMTASDDREASQQAATALPPDAAALAAGIPQSREPGVPMFDSGVVAIHAFDVAGGQGERLYRFDFGGRSLIVAGCGARSADLIAAARGAKEAWAVVPAASAPLLEIERKAALKAGLEREARFIADPGATCLLSDAAISAFRDARLSGGMLAPLFPAAIDSPSIRAWRGAAAAPPGLSLTVGAPGTSLNLAAPAPGLAADKAGGAKKSAP